MESNTGADPVHAVRVPDELWQRLTQWAQESGVGNSEALRALLHIGTQETQEIQFRPSFKWMHDPLRTGKRHGQWLVAHVPTGSDWWDLDEMLSRIVGSSPAQGTGAPKWHIIPASQETTLCALFGTRPDRIRVHRVDLGAQPAGT